MRRRAGLIERKVWAAAAVVSLVLLGGLAALAAGPGDSPTRGAVGGISYGAWLPMDALRPADLPPCVNEIFEGAPECGGAQLVYDSADGYVLDQMICVNTIAPVAFNSCTWKYEGGSWSEVSSPNGKQPPALLYDGFVWDATDGYALLFGGTKYPSGGAFDASWSYRGGVWTNETSAPPFRFAQLHSTFDSSASEVLATYGVLSPGSLNWTTYLYAYRAGVWSNLSASSPTPPAFPIAAQMADDPTDNGVLYFGGWANHTGVQENSSWLLVNGVWRSVRSVANPPILYFPSMTYDSIDRYVVLVGGLLGFCSDNPCLFSNAVWEFSGGQWTNVTAQTKGPVPLEAEGAMVTDPATSSVIEGFGWVGYIGSGINLYATPQSNLYSYVNGTWTEVPNTSGAPYFLLAVVVAGSAIAAGAAISGFLLLRARRGSRRPPDN